MTLGLLSDTESSAQAPRRWRKIRPIRTEIATSAFHAPIKFEKHLPPAPHPLFYSKCTRARFASIAYKTTSFAFDFRYRSRILMFRLFLRAERDLVAQQDHHFNAFNESILCLDTFFGFIIVLKTKIECDRSISYSSQVSSTTRAGLIQGWPYCSTNVY